MTGKISIGLSVKGKIQSHLVQSLVSIIYLLHGAGTGATRTLDAGGSATDGILEPSNRRFRI